MLANGAKMYLPSDGLTSRIEMGFGMKTEADEVINQGADWQEVEAEQEQTSEAEEAIEQDEPEAESDEQAGEESEGGEQAAEEEVELFLGDEKLGSPTSEPEVKDTDLVKNLRKEIQERNKKIHELEKQKSAPAVSADEQLVMPTLEDADYDDAASESDTLPQEPEADPLEGMTLSEMRELARTNGIDLGSARGKADVAAVLREHL